MNGARVRVAVLVSGRGTNLRALLEAGADAAWPARIVTVISNHPNAPALDIARAHQVGCVAMPVSGFDGSSPARDRAMVDVLRAASVRLVVCAGYDRVLSDEFLDAFPDAIINVHPSILPAFGGGMHAIEEALVHGVKVTGCTIQLLARGEADGGPIVLQAPVPVLEDDDIASLHRRVHEQEWRFLPEAVAMWCTGRLVREGRRVRILPPSEIPVRVGVAVAPASA